MNMDELWNENKALKHNVNALQHEVERLEAQLCLLRQAKYKKTSEKHPLQTELDLFNEAEVIDAKTTDTEEPEVEEITYQRKKQTNRKNGFIPDHLQRVTVQVDCLDSTCPCCKNQMQPTTPVAVEELAILPARHYVVRTEYQRLKCRCKEQPPVEAKRIKRCLPGSRVHPLALSTMICQKYDNGLPLFRQEKMAKANNVALTRENMARWIIQVSKKYFQPFVNLLSDEFFEYDIAYMDETRIQVLKEDGRPPDSKSQLWIRRGGRPDKQVIILDYDQSRGFDAADRIVNGFKGTLISDAYIVYYNLADAENSHITNALCNDHSRRKFKEAFDCLPKKSKHGSISDQALRKYQKLYKIESETKEMSLEERHDTRAEKAKPLWTEFVAWAENMLNTGVMHQKTVAALKYLLNHKEGLMHYLKDSRLPISNIKAEHVAKAVAVPRKNFLFCDTTAGAHASALCFSMIETAKLHGHHAHQYLTVLLSELPKCTSVEDYEQWLPWNVSKKHIQESYQTYPVI